MANVLWPSLASGSEPQIQIHNLILGPWLWARVWQDVWFYEGIRVQKTLALQRACALPSAASANV